MGILRKTANKLGLIKSKFNTIRVLHGDYLAFKALSLHYEIAQYELFSKTSQYFADNLRHDYRTENTELFMKMATLANAVKEYEKRYGKLYNPSETI